SSRQEVLVVKVCAATKDFEGVAKVVFDQFWILQKTAYNAYPDEEGYGEYDEYLEEWYEEDAPCVGRLGGIEEHTTEQHMPDAGNPTEAYDFHEEIDEYNATALNALVDLGEGETEGDKSIGEAIQLQLAAFVAFGQVKGRGEGKPKGKRKVMRLLGIKEKTFWEILHDHPDYFAWTQKNAKSPGASEFAEWVNQHFEYRGTVVYRRWSNRQPVLNGVTVLQIDCRHFHDPDNDRNLRGRSVGIAIFLYHFFVASEWRSPKLIHFHSPEWSEMSCSGRCEATIFSTSFIKHSDYFGSAKTCAHSSSPPDREAAGSDLTMEVLANQAHELSGLVWQEDPRRIGDLGVEVVEASLPVYGEDRRQQLEREIYALLHGDDGAPYYLPAEEQQMMGIRVDIRVRSHIRNTGINGGKWMKQRNWVKPAFFRPRDTHGALKAAALAALVLGIAAPGNLTWWMLLSTGVGTDDCDSARGIALKMPSSPSTRKRDTLEYGEVDVVLAFAGKEGSMVKIDHKDLKDHKVFGLDVEGNNNKYLQEDLKAFIQDYKGKLRHSKACRWTLGQ
ncbi:unnamed protein product, partial [Cladocopium goreaui]